MQEYYIIALKNTYMEYLKVINVDNRNILLILHNKKKWEILFKYNYEQDSRKSLPLLLKLLNLLNKQSYKL